MTELGVTSDGGSVQQTVQRYLGRIRQLGSLNTVIVTMPTATTDARTVDRADSAGQWLGPTHGMPIILKDNIDTAGVATTCGSDFLRSHVPATDARLVERLRCHGAVILGKSNLDEFAFGPFGTNSHFGDVVNPWNAEYVTGGSSSGSAAAVAAGLCIGAVGTDSGGSIRVPAAVCGVAGLRPTLDLVPTQGVTPVSPLLDTVGPMARRVTDVMRLLAAMMTSVPARLLARPANIEGEVPDLRGVRVGIPDTYFFADVDDEWAIAADVVARQLESLGASVHSCQLPGASDCQDAVSVLLHADAAAFHAARLDREPGRFTPALRARLERGTSLRAVDYAEALSWQREWSRRIRDTFREHDIMLTPTLPGRPPRVDDARLIGASSDLTRFTYAASLAAIPALALPCGFDRAGIPLSVQLLGPRWSDQLLLDVGCAYQRITEWHRQPAPCDPPWSAGAGPCGGS